MITQPLKRQQILAIFGTKYGTKLLNWLDPCCSDFCKAVEDCGIVGLTGYHGSFYDTTTQSVPLGQVKAMELNTTDALATSGFSITNNTLGRPTRITAANTGVYNLQFSAQLNRNSGGNTKQIAIWIAVNGTPVPDSATGLNVQANANKLVAAWNWFVLLNAGQYVEIMWTQDDAIDIIYQSATGVIPVGIPSVITTINQVG